jgi:catechol 2,3-dioxygenase
VHDRLTSSPGPPEEGEAVRAAESFGIPPDTSIGTVRLTVSDLARSRAFYEQALGLETAAEQGASAVLAAQDGNPLVELHGDPGAPPLDHRATGLFHLAILVPSRVELARSLWRLAIQRWPLSGASDHLVSEALYLSDPDGNGIEIYRDRPRSEWPHADGQLRMATLPLDLDNLAEELSGSGDLGERPSPASPLAHEPIAAGTRLGHVHLQVAALDEAEDFYSGLLGFEVTVRGYPGALFVSAGGYHHHIGLNVWNSAGAAAPPAGAIGLRDFELLLPDGPTLEVLAGRLSAAGRAVERVTDGLRVRDPAGNALLLRDATLR